MRRFKDLTTGHAIIMGRKTLDSIGKPLPNRLNIVLTRRHDVERDDVVWAHSVEDALFIADIFSIENNLDEVFVVGGDEVYNLFMSYLSKVYLTEVDAQDICGDAFFTPKFDRRTWSVVESLEFPASKDDQYPFTFKTLEKRDKYSEYRYRISSDVLTDRSGSDKWLIDQGVSKYFSIKNIHNGKYSGGVPGHWRRSVSKIRYSGYETLPLKLSYK